jgi:hypothetical protein
MAKRSTPVDRIVIDPLFTIPEGAEEQFVFSREGTDEEINLSEDDFEFSSDLSDLSEDEFLEDYDDGFDDQDAVSLATPDVFSVIDQQLRRAPGGQQVVDIVIDTEDIEGALNYEIQVTPI